MSPVHPAYDSLFDSFAPESVRGNPAARQAWGRSTTSLCRQSFEEPGAQGPRHFFRGSCVAVCVPVGRSARTAWSTKPSASWHRRWKPILDVFDENGVDACFEVHPGEDIHDGASFEIFLDLLKNHPRCNLLYDPSHFILQQLNYLEYIDLYHERIRMFHVKDAEFNSSGRQGVYGGFQSWVNRAGRFRSLGDGQVDFTAIFSKLTQYGYDGWAVMEWECCIKSSDQGAAEGAPFIQRHIIQAGERAFDDFADSGTDRAAIRKTSWADRLKSSTLSRRCPVSHCTPEATTVFLGIDCGTQSTKALLISHEGAPFGRGSAPHALVEAAGGRREQQPQWWIEATILAVRAAIAQSGSNQVEAIGVSGQQHGLVVLDEFLRVIRPAKLWNDTETSAQNDDLLGRFGGAEGWLQRFGIAPLTGYTISKLLWLRKHEPENFARIRHILLPHDYLNFYLTGRLAAESRRRLRHRLLRPPHPHLDSRSPRRDRRRHGPTRRRPSPLCSPLENPSALCSPPSSKALASHPEPSSRWAVETI